jgi:hypothetical protein
MTRTLLALALIVTFPAQRATRAPESGPARIILIRHAEKPDDPDDPHLSPAGVKRAKRLVTYITTDPAMTKFGSPVAVFATATTKHDDGQRTQETVAPLARALKLTVQTPFLGKGYAALARQVLANPSYRGKTVLICWNHEAIPELALALGVVPQPPKWKGSDFDQVYVISYAGGTVTLATYRYAGE